MGADTKIEWCDATFNPVSGCTKVSPGCANCYAEKLAKRAPKTLGGWGPGAPRRRTSAANWREPLRWNRAAEWAARDAEACGRAEPRRPRVFCASLADWLDDEWPVDVLSDLLGLIRATPHLDWLLLTKRPQNWHERIGAVADFGCSQREAPGSWGLARSWLNGDAPENVWVGTTVEDQKRAEERIPALGEIPARVRFLSGEPLLERVDLEYWLVESVVPQVDWVICGGESGPGARPMHPDWARALRDQCAAAGVAFFFKQWGDWLPGCQYFPGTRVRERAQHTFDADNHSFLVGKKDAGRLLDGVEHNAFPHPNP